MSNDRAIPLGGEQKLATTLRAARACLGGRLGHECAFAALAISALLAQMPVAQAAIECVPISQPLVKIPELVSQNGVLRGTVLLRDVQQRVKFRSAVAPGTPGAAYECQPQWVRAFRGLDAQPPAPPNPPVEPTLPDPLPGPTLRARVGDIVQLTFVNQLDPNKFGATHNEGAPHDVKGCDMITGNVNNPGYPYKSLSPDKVPGDTFPDCFHGSSTANIHFHGTHTNPNGTADNVLLEVMASPRVNNEPTIGPDTYKDQFDTFFRACERQLRGDALAEWPSNWYGPNDPQHPGGSSLGPWMQSGTWTNTQMSLLDPSDQAANTKVAQAGQWPQYYVGAFPYCFLLPNYPYASFPPPPGGIQMGQAPGTHWYHAHKHGSTAIDVANGMVGAFIIEGKYDDDLNAFYGAGWTRTQPVIVLNQTGVEPNLKRGPPGRPDKGPDFSVNGQAQPIIDMAPNEVQLWRIVNGSGRSGAFINGFPPAFNFRQIAQDGVQFADPNYQNSLNQSLLVASGNRADLLVQAPRIPGIYPLMVQHEVDPSDLPSAIPVVLLQIRVRDVPPVTGPRSQFIPTAPEQPAFLKKNITEDEVTGNQTIRFQTVSGPKLKPGAKAIAPFTQHMINDHKFDDDSPPVQVTLNAVEEWKVMNYTFGPPISHPFHIHLNPFQIVEVFDPSATVQSRQFGTVPKYVTQAQLVDASVQCAIDPNQESTWKDCHNPIDLSTPQIWWDVFPIPSGNQIAGSNVPGFFRMRSRFVDYPGTYVLHCHILAHEDRGMMTIVQLQPAGAPKPMMLTHH
jgi:FtsP/CotA-like multicopper oxidase with cupredoxin domain